MRGSVKDSVRIQNGQCMCVTAARAHISSVQKTGSNCVSVPFSRTLACVYKKQRYIHGLNETCTVCMQFNQLIPIEHL